MKQCPICGGYVLRINGEEVHTKNTEKIEKYGKLDEKELDLIKEKKNDK